jgi:cytochrome c peroxidase
MKKSCTSLCLILILFLVACKKETIVLPKTNDNYDAETDYNGLSDMEILGKKLFFDKSLSNPGGQSCASCHSIKDGFTDPNHTAFSRGIVNTLIGIRNAPSIAYMKYSSALYYNNVDSTYMGGFFWDGRVNSLEAQAMKPLLNPIEMNNTSLTQIYNKLQNVSYSDLFVKIYGSGAFDDSTATVQFALSAISAYERSSQVNSFSSKYDAYLNGEAQLNAQELRGLALFNDTAKGNCAACHPSDGDNNFGVALFTDFSYDNIGVPHNSSSPSPGPDFGLGAYLSNASVNGQFKVPTLRNVGVTAPYFHNGVFNTLEEVVTFYARRDSVGLFAPPEVNQNVNKDELGKLPLNDQEIKDIAAFLRTLTDGYKR